MDEGFASVATARPFEEKCNGFPGRTNTTRFVATKQHCSCHSEATMEPTTNGQKGLPSAAQAQGRIVSIRGSVIDVTFPKALPGLHEALKATNGHESL